MLWKKIISLSGEEALVECRGRRSGLFDHEVRERQERFGVNQITGEQSFWRELILRRFRSSFLYLLLLAAILSFFLGDRIEALLIGVFILINVGLESFQEYHSASALRLLKRFVVSHVKVRRDGEVARLESRELVPGDIVLVEAGDRLAADIRFLESTGLFIDESVMTGESAPVPKVSAAMKIPTAEMHEATNVGFAGTVVVSGKGLGMVLATGRDTALGDAILLSEETVRESAFEKGIARFSRFILRLVLLTVLLIFIANILVRGGEASIGELLVFSLALAVTVVPEALPVIVTVALSRGSLKLAQRKVVVKRLSAIEDLGSIDILCVDKTGTITENALGVTGVRSSHERETLLLASVASHEAPVNRSELHDPFDLALWNALRDDERHAVAGWRRSDTLPFDPARRRNSVMVDTGEKHTLIVRGAFEEVLAQCDHLPNKERTAWLEWGHRRGERGERVLAIATRSFAKKRKLTPDLETDLTLIGFVAFADPLKQSAAATLREAERLGVHVKILTGDSREVAGAVAHAVGLIQDPRAVMTGAEFDRLSPAEQQEAVEHYSVFARVSPDQKYAIMKVMQGKHEVGFLGEGINDAPALKLANVAIVVQGAADIARESADVILLQRHLGTIVEGIREGRVIFSNIRKYLLITLASNFGNFYAVAMASLFLPFVPLLPIQILLLNLLSDFPMIALATDNVDHEELEKPRAYQVGTVILMATFLGLVSSFFDLLLFAWMADQGPAALQTAWFMLSVVTEVILIFSLRTKLLFWKTKRPSFVLLSLSLVAVVAAWLIPFSVMGQQVFQFIHPTPMLLGTILSLVVVYFAASETVKRFYVTHFEGAQPRSSASA